MLEKTISIVGSNNTNKTGYGAWKNGQVYFAPFWIGYEKGNIIHRVGYSHPYVQSLTQNFVHKYITPTPFFLNYDNFRSGPYSYFGRKNHFSLWNY